MRYFFSRGLNRVWRFDRGFMNGRISYLFRNSTQNDGKYIEAISGRLDHGLRGPRRYAVTPFAFRAIQCLVGRSQNVAYGSSMVRKESHTHGDADGSQELAGIFHTKLLHLLAQDLCPMESAGHIRIGEHQRELFSTVAAGDILAARVAFQEVSERPKKRVAGLRVSWSGKTSEEVHGQ